MRVWAIQVHTVGARLWVISLGSHLNESGTSCHNFRGLLSIACRGTVRGVGIWALRAMKGNSDGAGNSDVAGT